MLKILSVKGIGMAIVEKIHIAVNVSSLTEGEAFYTRLLGAAATKRVSDQIDWVIDNPPVHFSIFCNDPHSASTISASFIAQRTSQGSMRHLPFQMTARSKDRTICASNFMPLPGISGQELKLSDA
jgi:hypothetical protein